MLRLLLLIAAVLTVWYGARYVRRLRKLPPGQRRKALWRAAFVALALLLLVLAVTGRANWLAAAAVGMLVFARNLAALAMRLLPLLHVLGAGGARIGPTLTTAWLQVKISLTDGSLDGHVLQGEFAGRPLSALARDQLQRLLAHLQGADRQSALLLNAYVVRRFGGSAWGGAQGAGREQADPVEPSSAMTDAEAVQILGIELGASSEAVVQAHRRLIQKLHPDRGGSDYLAAKVNAAKDHLLRKV